MREIKIIDNIIYGKCNKCWKRLPLENFKKSKRSSYWRRNECKQCWYKYQSEWISKNKEKRNESRRKMYQKNPEKYKTKKQIKYKENPIQITNKILKYNFNFKNKYWFNWTTFHLRSKRYCRKYNLYPKFCSICGKEDQIVIHHPSYENFGKWKEVVFCCPTCHSWIHKGRIQNIKPINLIKLNLSINH